jgi:peptide/nickel transport system substrate-binding protein
VDRSADGAQLSLVLRTGLRWPGGGREVAAHDVAGLLIARANRHSSAFDPAWTEVLQSVSTEGMYGVRIEFLQPQVSPEAWLQVPLAAADSASRSAPALGPFVLEQQTPREAHYLAQTGSFQPQAGGAKEIVERVYLDPGLALRALKRGDVSVVDRINPWEVAAARATPEIVVEPYAAPSVHVLVPNQRKPLLANRAFRRALSLGLDRAAILERALLGGKSTPGSSLVSGPFPKPASADDPRGAAYDIRIEPRGYDPSQSLLLAGLGLQEVALAEKKRGHAFKPLQKITLAYPPHETARVACQSIVRQWRLVGVQIGLRELQPGEALGVDWDLAYVELRMTEPVVDVWRLFGPDAIAGGASPTIAQAMQELRQAADATAANAKLREIHGWVDRETALIPLWQLVDHLAYQQTLRGVGQRPTTLYQNVEQWQTGAK